MSIEFTLWSSTNPNAEKEMTHNLGLRNWNDLEPPEKKKIWYYLRQFFEGEKSDSRIFFSVYALNEKYKYKSYGEKFLTEPSKESAKEDFRNIFFTEDQGVFFELISFFCRVILYEKKEETFYRNDGEKKENYNKRYLEWRYEEIDNFKNRLNDVFEQFGINIILTRNSLIPRQEKKIINQIYHPVLDFLSDEKWKEVNRELSDAFQNYQKKTREGYSNSITHAISAIEAFLQLSLYGKTGKGTLGKLIKEAVKGDLIPDDLFSQKIFENIKSILAKERKEAGDAHPKKDYASEKNTRLILNLTMIFLQHCIQDAK